MECRSRYSRGANGRTKQRLWESKKSVAFCFDKRMSPAFSLCIKPHSWQSNLPGSYNAEVGKLV